MWLSVPLSFVAQPGAGYFKEPAGSLNTPAASRPETCCPPKGNCTMNRSPLSVNICRAACLVLVIIALAVPCASAIALTPGSTGSIATIARGDPVTISGIATGRPQIGLQIWFIGYNFVKISTVSVNSDNTFAYTLRGTDTANLAPGQYFVIVQHPMENGRFDIVYDASTGMVKNVQTGQTVFSLTGSGSLQGPSGVTALLTAIGSQNIDDTFSTVSFSVSQPAVAITFAGTVPQGTNFTLNGTTSLAPGDNLMVDITSSSFGPATKTSSFGFPGAAGMVTVQPGNGGLNTWSFTVDTSPFPPGDYLVTVSGITQSAIASGKFTVIAAPSCGSSGETCPIPGVAPNNGTALSATPAENSTMVPVSTTLPPATPALPATTMPVPIPAALSVAGILAAALLCSRRP